MWNFRRNSSKMTEGSSSTEADSTTASQLNAQHFSISVISLEGGIIDINVEPGFAVEQIKTEVLKQIYDKNAPELQFQFRLIHSRKFKPLSDNSTVTEEEIVEHDELMLVEFRPFATAHNSSVENLEGPNMEAVLEATSHLPLQHTKRPVLTGECPVEFVMEFRKILISLVRASAKILMYSPDVEKLCNVLSEKFKSVLVHNVDQKSVDILKNYGYSHKKILMALELKKSNVARALEWLIQREDYFYDEEILDDLLSAECNPEKPGPSSSENRGSKKEKNLIELVEDLLKIFRRHRKMDAMPHVSVIAHLEEMGFEKKNIIEAFKITGNNKAKACLWLLGDRRPSLQDLDEGLDPDSPIYNPIMNNPCIQLGLTNPKVLLAFLSILESPDFDSTFRWSTDSEVSPVMSEITEIYQNKRDAVQ